MYRATTASFTEGKQKDIEHVNDTVLYEYAALSIIFSTKASSYVTEQLDNFKKQFSFKKSDLDTSLVRLMGELPYVQEYRMYEIAYCITSLKMLAVSDDEWHASIQQFMNHALQIGYEDLFTFTLSVDRHETKEATYKKMLRKANLTHFERRLYICLYLYAASLQGYFCDTVDLDRVKRLYKGELDLYFQGLHHLKELREDSEEWLANFTEEPKPKKVKDVVAKYMAFMSDEAQINFTEYLASHNNTIRADKLSRLISKKKYDKKRILFNAKINGMLFDTFLNLDDLRLIYAQLLLTGKMKKSELLRTIATYTFHKVGRQLYTIIEDNNEKAIENSMVKTSVPILPRKEVHAEESDIFEAAKAMAETFATDVADNDISPTIKTVANPQSSFTSAITSAYVDNLEQQLLDLKHEMDEEEALIEKTPLKLCFIGTSKQFEEQILHVFPSAFFWDSKNYADMDTAALDKQDVIVFVATRKAQPLLKRVRMYLNKSNQKHKLLVVQKSVAPEALLRMAEAHAQPL